MICPKCGVEQKEGNLECIRCVVIFAKLTPDDFLSTPAEMEAEAIHQPRKEVCSHIAKVYLFGSNDEENPF